MLSCDGACRYSPKSSSQPLGSGHSQSDAGLEEIDGLTKSVQRVGLVYLAIWEQAVSGRLFPETQAFILKVTRLILEMFGFSKTK